MDKLSQTQLKALTHGTLGHYESRAESFWEGTRDHDVSQNIQTLLRFIEAPAPCRILDLGCGPGRDLAMFRSMGHDPIGLDGSPAFCRMARANSGCEVLHQDFLALDLPKGVFDGIFANASLFHIPTQELPRVLNELRAALKARGVLFSSNPRGQNTESWQGERFGAYHDLSAWRRFLSGARFEELTHFYRPVGLPRDQQPWLASAWRAI